MITGVVSSAHEMVIRLRVRDSVGKEHEIETVIDTGFTGSLSLPPSVIANLGLPWHSKASAVVAGGKIEQFDAHLGTVIWDGTARPILVHAADNEPLLGMQLLIGHDMWVCVTFGGDIRIEKLP